MQNICLHVHGVFRINLCSSHSVEFSLLKHQQEWENVQKVVELLYFSINLQVAKCMTSIYHLLRINVFKIIKSFGSKYDNF